MNKYRVRGVPPVVRFLSAFLAINLFLGQCVPGYVLQSLAAPTDAGALTVGGHSGEEEFESFGDIVLPLWASPEHGMVFANPRVSVTSEDQQEVNLGVGYRRLLGGNMIVGANIFYDGRWTDSDNFFSQVGAGLEFLSEWIDARANWYVASDDEELVDTREQTFTTVEGSGSGGSGWSEMMAEGNTLFYERGSSLITTTHQVFNKYEKAIDGFDAELGVKVPYVDTFAETRLFVGYQSFSKPYDDGRYEGMKGRVEVRALPGLTVDAEYFEEDELNNNSEYYVGARVRVPFDLMSIGQGENPFAGAVEEFKRGSERPFESRMTEMVIRDMKVRRSQSEYMEDETKRTTTVTGTGVEKVVVTDTATFVDGDNTTGVETGTHEQPYSDVQEGVDNAFGDKTVVVDDKVEDTGVYEENVVLTDGVKVYGKYPGLFGDHYGDVMPVVDGGKGNAPTFTMANDTVLHSMHVKNTGSGSGARTVSIGSDTYDVTTAGIVSDGANNILLDEVVVSDAGYGAVLAKNGSFNTVIRNSQFSDNSLEGLLVRGEGTSGDFVTTITGSVFANNGSEGLHVHADNFDTVAVTVSDSQFNDNGTLAYLTYQGDGFDLDVGGVDIFGTLVLSNVSAQGNYYDGFDLDIDAVGTGSASMTISDVVAVNNGYSAGSGDGLTADVTSQTNIAQLFMHNVTATGNDIDGVDAKVSSDAGLAELTVSDINVDNNYDDGLDIEFSSYSAATFNLTDLTVQGNGDNGIEASLSGYNGMSVLVDGIVSTNNSGDGIEVEIDSGSGLAQLTVSDINVDNNGETGLDIDFYSYAAASLNITNLTINGNGEDGLSVYASGYSGLDLTVSGVNAYGNSDAGIYVEVYGGYGGANVVISNVTVAFNGTGIDAVTGATWTNSTMVLTDITADNNYSTGIRATGVGYIGGDVSVLVTNSTACNNGGIGIVVGAYALGDSSAIVTVSDVVATNNGYHGMGVNSYAYGYHPYNPYATASVEMHVNNLILNDNGGSGLYSYMGMDSNSTALLSLNNVEANDNSNNGIDAVTRATWSDATVSMNGVTANNNGNYGVRVYAYAEYPGAINVSMTNVTANSNAGGVSVLAKSDNGVAEITLTDIEANNNDYYGGVAAGALAYSNAAVTLNDITATNNMRYSYGAANYFVAGGISAFAYSYHGSSLLITNAVANNNNSGYVGGISAFAFVGDGNADITLADIEANDNFGYETGGILVYGMIGISPSSGPTYGSGTLGITMSNVEASRNYTVNYYNGTIVPMGTDGGINVRAIVSGDINLDMSGVNAHSNSCGSAGLFYGNGVAALLLSQSNINVTISGINADYNSGNGVGVVAGWYGPYSGESVSVTLSNIQAHNNDYNGLVTYAYANDDVSVFAGNVDATGNGSADGGGVLLYAASQYADTSATLTNVNASANSNGGIGLNVGAFSNATVTLNGIQANNNASNGVSAWVSSGYENVTLDITDSTVTNNSAVGVYVNGFAGSTTNLSMRTNSIFGNTSFDLMSTNSIFNSTLVVDAQYNWWGTATPAAGQFSGSIITNNPLPAAP